MRRLVRDARGAATVEMLVAFPVFFAFFLSIVQVSAIEVAALVTQHAAVVAARGSVVVAADDPKFYGGTPGSLDGARKQAVLEGVGNVLRISSDARYDVRFEGGFAEGAIARATVTLHYPCRVPVGATIVCGLGRTKDLVRTAAMPSQTVGYEYP